MNSGPVAADRLNPPKAACWHRIASVRIVWSWSSRDGRPRRSDMASGASVSARYRFIRRCITRRPASVAVSVGGSHQMTTLASKGARRREAFEFRPHVTSTVTDSGCSKASSTFHTSVVRHRLAMKRATLHRNFVCLAVALTDLYRAVTVLWRLQRRHRHQGSNPAVRNRPCESSVLVSTPFRYCRCRQ